MRRVSIALLLMLLAGCGQPIAAPTAPDSRVTASGTSGDLVRLAPVDDGDAATAIAVYRSGLPDNFDFKAPAPGLEALGRGLDTLKREHGLRSIINLLGSFAAERGEITAERQLAEARGLAFTNLPIPFNQLLDKAWGERFLTALDRAPKPVWVHCKQGRDRTGTMIALYRMREAKLSPKAALDEMIGFGFEPKKYPRFAEFVLAWP